MRRRLVFIKTALTLPVGLVWLLFATASLPVAAEYPQNQRVEINIRSPQDSSANISFPVIHFEHDASQIPPEQQSQVASSAELLKKNPAVKVVIAGHCDPGEGDDDYTLALGQGRAEAVRGALIASGVEKSRLVTMSFGRGRPVQVGQKAVDLNVTSASAGPRPTFNQIVTEIVVTRSTVDSLRFFGGNLGPFAFGGYMGQKERGSLQKAGYVARENAYDSFPGLGAYGRYYAYESHPDLKKAVYEAVRAYLKSPENLTAAYNKFKPTLVGLMKGHPNADKLKAVLDPLMPAMTGGPAFQSAEFKAYAAAIAKLDPCSQDAETCKGLQSDADNQLKKLRETFVVSDQQILAYQWMQRRRAEGGQPLVNAWSSILKDFQAALTAAAAEPASETATRAQNIERCLYQPNLALGACTALIEGGEKLNPLLVQALINRAGAYAGKGELNSALHDADQAVAVDPKNAIAYMLRTGMYGAVGDHAHALESAAQATQLEPTNADAWNSRCWEEGIIGKLSEALTDCNEALRLQPRNPAIIDSRGFVYLKQGNDAAAIADYDAVLRTSRNFPTSLYGRGVAKLRQGNQVTGGLDIAAAKRLNPGVGAMLAKYGIPEPANVDVPPVRLDGRIALEETNFTCDFCPRFVFQNGTLGITNFAHGWLRDAQYDLSGGKGIKVDVDFNMASESSTIAIGFSTDRVGWKGNNRSGDALTITLSSRDKGGVYWLRKGMYTTFLEAKQPVPAVRVGQWNHLSASITADSVSVVVNGTDLGSHRLVAGDVATKGYVGFYGWTPPFTTEIKNLDVVNN